MVTSFQSHRINHREASYFFPGVSNFYSISWIGKLLLAIPRTLVEWVAVFLFCRWGNWGQRMMGGLPGVPEPGRRWAGAPRSPASPPKPHPSLYPSPAVCPHSGGSFRPGARAVRRFPFLGKLQTCFSLWEERSGQSKGQASRVTGDTIWKTRGETALSAPNLVLILQ